MWSSLLKAIGNSSDAAPANDTDDSSQLGLVRLVAQRLGLLKTSRLLQVRVNTASTSATQLVAAVAGQTTRVHRLRLSAAVANTVSIKLGLTTVETFNLPAGGCVVLNFSVDPYYTTAVNQSINVTLANATQVDGMLEYVTSA